MALLNTSDIKLKYGNMEFSGRVDSRSSKKQGGPPGEMEILELNPGRKVKILSCTGWPKLFPGTLNLKVRPEVLVAIKRYTPCIYERGEDVYYPVKYRNIPIKRKAYLYFAGNVSIDGEKINVLIRIAENPLPNLIEVFASEKLRDLFNLSDGDVILCEIQ